MGNRIIKIAPEKGNYAGYFIVFNSNPQQNGIMWLKYGIDADNTLVAIEDVLSGKTLLSCPYCRSGLTAKK